MDTVLAVHIEFNRPLTEDEQNRIAQAVRLWLEDLTDNTSLFARWEFSQKV